MKNPITKSIIAFAFLLSFSFSLQASNIYYVKQSGTGDGTSWENAAGDIQAMIDKSVSGDEVWVAKGTYYPTVETIVGDVRSRSFVTKAEVPLCGGFAGTESLLAQRLLADLDSNGKVDSFEMVNTTLLSGDIDGFEDVWVKNMNDDQIRWQWTITGNEGNCYNVVKGSGNSTVDGFSIEGGNANNYPNNVTGGGVNFYLSSQYMFSKSFIKNCIVSNCYGMYGGGINSYSSNSYYASSKVNNCFVKDCFSLMYGGGIESSNNSTVAFSIIENCSSGTFGGGIASYSSSGKSYPIIVNSNVINCSAQYGGGIYSKGSSSATASVVNSIVINCSASYGGGIYSAASGESSISYIFNCNILNCSASNGGGVYVGAWQTTYSSSYPTVSSFINNVVANCSSHNGGGVYSQGSTFSIPILENCALINNKDSDIVSNYFDGIRSNIISPDLELTFIKPSNFVGVAKNNLELEELKTANWHLKNSSSCINNGTSNIPTSNLFNLDMDTNPRLQDGKIDIGAYEYSSLLTPIDKYLDGKLFCYLVNGRLLIRNIDKESSVQLYDINGQLIAKQIVRDITFNISLPHRGIYLVKINTGNIEKSEKVVW